MADDIRFLVLRPAGGKPRRVLLARQRLAGTPEELFPFFADPRNLEPITPPFLRFRVLEVSSPPGETVTSGSRHRPGTLRARLARCQAWRPGPHPPDRAARGQSPPVPDTAPGTAPGTVPGAAPGTGPGGGGVAEGVEISYRLRLHGLPVPWRGRIEDWDPPHRFVDRQLRGPYRLWLHEHRFEPDGAGGTIAHDRVEYALPLPWGPLEKLVHEVSVERDLREVFGYRQRRLAELLTAPGAAGPTRPRSG